jgi:hypothetical protein
MYIWVSEDHWQKVRVTMAGMIWISVSPWRRVSTGMSKVIWRVAAVWNILRTTIAIDTDMLIKISRMRPATTTPFVTKVRIYYQSITSVMSYIYGWVSENPWPNSAIVESCGHDVTSVEPLRCWLICREVDGLRCTAFGKPYFRTNSLFSYLLHCIECEWTWCWERK